MVFNDKENSAKIIIEMSKRMRLKALDMALGAGRNGAHLGPAFSCSEIIATLYGKIMHLDPKNPFWEERDRFMASKAHCVLSLYTALAEVGFLSSEDLKTFEKNGSFLTGHPSMDITRGFEYSGGSLGMAMSVCVGMALDAKQRGRKHKVFTLLGDGELDEGSNWEAFMSASHFKLDNLVAIIDKNILQYDGPTDEIMSLGDLEAKFKAFGWYVTKVDGHNVMELLEALNFKSDGLPYVIIANTVKGKGVSFMENVKEWHHGVLSQKQYDQAVAEIKGEIPC